MPTDARAVERRRPDCETPPDVHPPPVLWIKVETRTWPVETIGTLLDAVRVLLMAGSTVAALRILTDAVRGVERRVRPAAA